MKTVKLENLNDLTLYFRRIHAVEMTPKQRYLKLVDRGLNSFLYVTEGEVEYIFADKRYSLKPQALIYLPKGSNHIYRSVTPVVRYIRLDFQLFDADDGEMVVFSALPELISRTLYPEMETILHDLCQISLRGTAADSMRQNSLMFHLMEIVTGIKKRENEVSSGRLAAKILEYIERNYTAEITGAALCKALHISPTHMRRAFKRHTGQTITEYVNHYRIQRSLYLLTQTELSILDIALNLGFNNAEYFHRVFKNIMGVSPSLYRKETL